LIENRKTPIDVEILTTSTKLYTFGPPLDKPKESPILKEVYDISTPSKVNQFAASENCLHERHTFIYWLSACGVYRIQKFSLSDLTKIEFLKPNTEIKSIASTAYHIAGLTTNNKIVIKNIIDNSTTTVLTPNITITSLLTSTYFYSQNDREPIFEDNTMSFWAYSSKSSHILMFNGKKAGESLWKTALKVNDHGLSRQLLVGFLDNEDDQAKALEIIDYHTAEKALEKNDLKTAANFYAKISLNSTVVAKKFQCLDDQLYATKHLLQYYQKKISYSIDQPESVQIYLIKNIIQLYAITIVSQTTRVELSDGNEIELKVLTNMRADFSRFINLELITNLLKYLFNMQSPEIFSIYSDLKNIGEIEMIVNISSIIDDYKTTIDTLIDGDILQEALSELENRIPDGRKKASLLEEYLDTLLSCPYLDKETVMSLVLPNVEHLNTGKILAIIYSKIDGDTDLQAAADVIESWEAVFENDIDNFDLLVYYQVLIYLKLFDRSFTNEKLFQKLQNWIFDRNHRSKLIHQIQNRPNDEKLNILLDALDGEFQTAIEKVCVEYKLAVRILNHFIDTFEHEDAKQVKTYNWLKIAERSIFWVEKIFTQ